MNRECLSEPTRIQLKIQEASYKKKLCSNFLSVKIILLVKKIVMTPQCSIEMQKYLQSRIAEREMRVNELELRVEEFTDFVKNASVPLH